jgi:hypothetical protein
MPKFNPNQLKASAPHKVPVTLTIRDEAGEKVEVETYVYYRGLSLDDQATFPSVDGLEGEARIAVVKKQLSLMVHSIPDFGVGPGEAQKADEAFFGEMEDGHVNAISEAIAEDRDPNVKPSSSSRPTTGAEGQ